MIPEENVELKKFTTFKIGGPARYFFRVRNLDEAREALGFARLENLPHFVLGGGSNLLASDSGFSGIIIKNEILGVSFTEVDGDVLAIAGAGEHWDSFVSETVRRGLYGLENLSGIPGTVGSAPIQNIGAYGTEVKEVIVSVEAIDSRTDRLKKFSNADCHFGYRHSFFKTTEGKNFIITAVQVRLKKRGALNLDYKDLKNYFAKTDTVPTLGLVREVVLEIRRGKFPDLETCGTAGSFFKNPIIPLAQFEKLKKKFPDLPGFFLPTINYKLQTVKVPLAWILDNVCQLKGYRKGNIELFERQPIVVVNTGGASAKEAQELAQEVMARVKEKTGISIAWEVEKL